MQRAEDEWAIERLLRRFALLNDAGDHDALAALFTADGGFARPSAPDAVIEGRAAILAAFQDRPGRLARHVVCNAVVTWRGADEAEVRCYSLLFAAAEEGGARLSVGSFDDVVVRQEGVWLFKARRGRMVLDGLAVPSARTLHAALPG
ncbi:nuclear transport factor 2 family protein [Polymorphum gilvum]|uniref:SnoaL-like domain-containing protein n=1 Tax=Polymorphum gilvum (strain LMG 25793 / CGMCC 1.9160 / SL003B-26A1) TaxID=991905 RepID=F2IWY2_POLGS|nr:nuclear transport factor 2 family protein [Polymorphum gilvum]ADZ71559.1 hypothetical protein SL003B_3137 [Polymorphum gilvum SL003B-26A1]